MLVWSKKTVLVLWAGRWPDRLWRWWHYMPQTFYLCDKGVLLLYSSLSPFSKSPIRINAYLASAFFTCPFLRVNLTMRSLLGKRLADSFHCCNILPVLLAIHLPFKLFSSKSTTPGDWFIRYQKCPYQVLFFPKQFLASRWLFDTLLHSAIS